MLSQSQKLHVSQLKYRLNSRTFSNPSLNVAAAKLFELNQICDAFNSLRRIHFSNITNGKVGAFLGVNAFAFTYPTYVIPGNQNQSFDVKTKLGWTLDGEYENCNSPTTQQPASPHIFLHVSRNRTDEPGLDELVQQFWIWSIEADGIQKDPDQVYTKQEEQFLEILKNSINHNGERDGQTYLKIRKKFEKQLLFCTEPSQKPQHTPSA